MKYDRIDLICIKLRNRIGLLTACSLLLFAAGCRQNALGRNSSSGREETAFFTASGKENSAVTDFLPEKSDESLLSYEEKSEASVFSYEEESTEAAASLQGGDSAEETLSGAAGGTQSSDEKQVFSVNVETISEPSAQAGGYDLSDYGISREEIAVVLAAGDQVIDLSSALYTYDKMERDLKLLASAYPELMKLEAKQVTADGRNIYAVYFGNRNAEKQILICAATHAREYMTAQLVMKQLEYYCAHYRDGVYEDMAYSDIFETVCFVIVPMVNPDGVTISQLGEAGLNREDLRENLRNIYASDLNAGYTQDSYDTYLIRWKANALGVDLNRNFSPGWDTVTDRSVPSSSLYKGNAPGSEAEAAALISLINEMTNPLLAVSYHSYGDLVYWQYGQSEPLWSANQVLATHISNLTGHYLAGYSNEAGFSNWCVLEKNIRSVTVETGTVPAPLPLEQFADLWQRHRQMWAMLGYIYR